MPSRALVALVALLCVGALALAAGSLPSVAPGGGVTADGENASERRTSNGSSAAGPGGSGGSGHVLAPVLDGAGDLANEGSDRGLGSVLVVAVALLAAAGVAVYHGVGGDAAAAPTDEPPTDDDPPVTNPDTSNGVYRAWHRMVARLDADRRTNTPGELAAAAVAAGMDREAVADLTDCFRAVRYGPSAPTDDAERRATEALGRIEGEDE